jgi:hypothetical protein
MVYTLLECQSIAVSVFLQCTLITDCQYSYFPHSSKETFLGFFVQFFYFLSESRCLNLLYPIVFIISLDVLLCNKNTGLPTLCSKYDLHILPRGHNIMLHWHMCTARVCHDLCIWRQLFMPPPWNGRGHIVLPFVIPSFCHSVILSFRHSVIP